MTKVVIVGEIYNADLSIGGGPIMPGAPQPPLGIWGPPQMPPGIWPQPPSAGSPGYPSHPIYNPPYPDQGLPPGSPGSPTHPIYNPAYPSHPIAPGGPPLGMWGPGFPYPDQGLPGSQPQPGHGLPPFPSHPIWLPAQPIIPDAGDPTKAHVVVYVPGAGAVKFTVDLTELPEPTPPEATPKA